MTMGTRQAIRNPARSWGHNAVRLAILAAARRIVACDGPDAVTLSRAADEAGFARATVYGHFRNKEELLVSVIADDMATLGRMMREAGWDSHSEASVVDPKPLVAEVEPANDSPPAREELSPEETPSPQEPVLAAVEETAPAIEAAEPEPVSEPVPTEPAEEPAAQPTAEIVAPEPEEELVPEPVPETAHTETETAPVGQAEPITPRPSIRRADIRAVLAAQESVQPAPEVRVEPAPPVEIEEPAPPKTELPRADAWLERRLRVFERALADIETRLEKTERISERAQGLVVEGMRDLQLHVDTADRRNRESIENIVRRTETSDKRVRTSIAELREMLQDSFGQAPDAAAPLAAEYVPPEEVTEKPLELPQAPADAVHEEPRTEPSREPSESFLVAARRAANAAAQLAEAEQVKNTKGNARWGETEDDRRKLYTRYLMYGVGFLVLVLIGAGMVLRPGAAANKPVPAMAASAVKPPMQTRAAGADQLTVLANSGNAKAELVVGLRYLQATPANDTEAAFWLQRAADAHEPLAQYFLGTLYEHGKGVGKDAAKSVQWYEAAAGQGNRKAMQRLGVAYAEGLGTTKDLAQSARWFMKAANAGSVDAQFNLAVLYERGQGVPQSLLDAYKWYAIAAAQGDAESKSRIEALATQLSPDDMAAAERAVQAFVPTPVDPGANAVPQLGEVLGSR